MKSATTSSRMLDISAISLSVLCIIHCLSLPLLSIIIPMASVFGEAEWIHKLFVLAAVPITATAIFQDRHHMRWREFAITATLAVSTLVAAAFVEALHDAESLLTIAGAGLLAFAHGMRWQRRAQF